MSTCWWRANPRQVVRPNTRVTMLRDVTIGSPASDAGYVCPARHDDARFDQIPRPVHTGSRRFRRGLRRSGCTSPTKTGCIDAITPSRPKRGTSSSRTIETCSSRKRSDHVTLPACSSVEHSVGRLVTYCVYVHLKAARRCRRYD